MDTANIRIAVEVAGKSAEDRDVHIQSLLDELKDRHLYKEAQRITLKPDQRTKDAGTAVGWGQVLLTLAASGGVAATLITSIKEWLVRQRPEIKVRLKCGNNELEISGSKTPEMEALIREFLAECSPTRT